MEGKRRFFDVRKALVPLLLGLMAPCLAQDADNATGLQSHDSIRHAARTHVLSNSGQFPGNTQVSTSPLDRRLRLSQCDQPLETYESPNGLRAGRSVVGVRCNGSKPWKLYVPVKIAVLREVLVNKTPLRRGQLIKPKDLEKTQRDVATLHKGYYTQTKELTGLRAKRAIKPGSVLTAGMFAQDKIVRRGSQVEILARSSSLSVRMRGKAMANGAIGERIKVKNLTSGREVTGTIIEPGVVLVQQ